jgi:hypothetical protein
MLLAFTYVQKLWHVVKDTTRKLRGLDDAVSIPSSSKTFLYTGASRLFLIPIHFLLGSFFLRLKRSKCETAFSSSDRHIRIQHTHTHTHTSLYTTLHNSALRNNGRLSSYKLFPSSEALRYLQFSSTNHHPTIAAYSFITAQRSVP